MDPADARLARRLERAAAALDVPPTPDIAAAVGAHLAAERPPAPREAGRRLASPRLAAAALVVVALLALGVPAVRAKVLEVLQIGVVRILLAPPTPTPPPPTDAAPAGATRPRPAPPPTARPPTGVPLGSVLDLAGEVTLAEARASVGFPLRLPTYPRDLGAPDKVFVQDLGAPAVILVWLDPEAPDRVRLSLHVLTHPGFAQKESPPVLERTTVHGRPAAWAEGPYLLQLGGGRLDTTRLVEGHVLIWQEEGVTYRLETEASREEAVRIAESLVE